MALAANQQFGIGDDLDVHLSGPRNHPMGVPSAVRNLRIDDQTEHRAPVAVRHVDDGQAVVFGGRSPVRGIVPYPDLSLASLQRGRRHHAMRAQSKDADGEAVKREDVDHSDFTRS